MTIGDQIRDVKLQSDINREAAKISALSSDKLDKKNLILVILFIILRVQILL